MAAVKANCFQTGKEGEYSKDVDYQRWMENFEVSGQTTMEVHSLLDLVHFIISQNKQLYCYYEERFLFGQYCVNDDIKVLDTGAEDTVQLGMVRLITLFRYTVITTGKKRSSMK